MIDQLRAEIARLREGAAPLEPDAGERRALGSQALDHALAFLDEVETAPSLRPATEVFSERLDPEFTEEGRDAPAVLDYVGACIDAPGIATTSPRFMGYIPGGGLQLVSYFWRAAREIDPSIADDPPRAGVSEGDLVERFRRAGLQGVTGGTLETSVDYADFDDYWEPFTGAAGPATGAFYASLDDAGKATLRDTVRASLPEGPFTLPARAWLALGTVPG